MWFLHLLKWWVVWFLQVSSTAEMMCAGIIWCGRPRVRYHTACSDHHEVRDWQNCPGHCVPRARVAQHQYCWWDRVADIFSEQTSDNFPQLRNSRGHSWEEECTKLYEYFYEKFWVCWLVFIVVVCCVFGYWGVFCVCVFGGGGGCKFSPKLIFQNLMSEWSCQWCLSSC